LRLLVVGNPDLGQVFEDVLPGAHSVVSVQTAADALAIEPGGFDLILTGERMPVMSGLQLHAVLRDRGVSVPMVLVSGDHEACLRATASGFFGSLLKPFGLQELEVMLERVSNA
jgi:CheY-like chemotaxis protein